MANIKVLLASLGGGSLFFLSLKNPHCAPGQTVRGCSAQVEVGMRELCNKCWAEEMICHSFIHSSIIHTLIILLSLIDLPSIHHSLIHHFSFTHSFASQVGDRWDILPGALPGCLERNTVGGAMRPEERQGPGSQEAAPRKVAVEQRSEKRPEEARLWREQQVQRAGKESDTPVTARS